MMNKDTDIIKEGSWKTLATSAHSVHYVSPKTKLINYTHSCYCFQKSNIHIVDMMN